VPTHKSSNRLDSPIFEMINIFNALIIDILLNKNKRYLSIVYNQNNIIYFIAVVFLL